MRPKTEYWRSRAHLVAVASLPCMNCGREGETQASHSNQSCHGKGRGIKASDEFTAALCQACHAMVDSGRLERAAKVAIWDAAHRATLEALRRRGMLVPRWWPG